LLNAVMRNEEAKLWLTPPEARFIDLLFRVSDEPGAKEIYDTIKQSEALWVEEAYSSGMVAHYSPLANVAGSNHSLRWANASLAWRYEGSARECIAIELTDEQVEFLGRRVLAGVEYARTAALNFENYNYRLESQVATLADADEHEPVSEAQAESIKSSLFEDLLDQINLGQGILTALEQRRS